MLLLVLACADPITVLTYNAGLAVGFVPGAEDRAEPALAAASALQADVTCLQEVWLPEHRSLLDADYMLLPDALPQDSLEPACPEGELDSLSSCLEESCADATCADDLVDCVFSSCVFPFLSLEETCQGCIMANVGGEDVDVVLETCESGNTGYAYGGSFGTALLSRWPLLETQELVLDSTTNRRGVLRALVDSPLGEVDVYCTHLSAIFSLVPYPRTEGSWQEEQAAQIQTLRTWVDETATTEVQVLMGDFNNGPDEHEDHFDTLSEGWDRSWNAGCTYCGDNPLNSEGSDDREIDHVLTRGFEGDVQGSRVLDQALEITRCGESQDGALSDHYGVLAELVP